MARCKPALEWILNMPFKDTCKGVVEVEDWVMSPCHLCEKYLEILESSQPVRNHEEPIYLQANELSGVEDVLLKSPTFNENVTVKVMLLSIG